MGHPGILIAVVLGLAAGTTATGRALVGVLGARSLRRRSPENFAIAALLGTGLWILVFGYCSYLRAPARLATAVTLAGSLGLVMALILLGRWRDLLPPRPRPSGLPAQAGCVAACALTLLAPLAYRSFNVWNDTFAYISSSESLQRAGFGALCDFDGSRPLEGWLLFHQLIRVHIGSVFFLSMIEAGCPGLRAVELFRPVMAWTVVLNLFGVFLLCRWSLRCRRLVAAAAVLFTATTFNPLFYCVAWGFFAQLFGTALLAGSVALMARMLRGRYGRWQPALLFGVLAAALISAYYELGPILAGSCVTALLLEVGRARRLRRLGAFARFAGLTALAVVALANVECVRGVRGILINGNAVAGSHRPWSAAKYWSFLLGTRPVDTAAFLRNTYAAGWAGHPEAAHYGIALATLIASAGFGVGLLRVAPRRGTLGYGPALGCFALMLAYFQFAVRDPWTGETGHTWSMFKLCKWTFVFVVPVVFLGLQVLLRRLRAGQVVIVAGALAAGLASLPVHVAEARGQDAAMRWSVRSDDPFVDFHRLSKRVDALNPESLYLARQGGAAYTDSWAAYWLFPRRFANSWSGAVLLPLTVDPDFRAFDTRRMLCLANGESPAAAAAQRLPAGFTVAGNRVLTWKPGFYVEERSGGVRWRWCTEQGALEILNTGAEPQTVTLKFEVGTVQPGPAELFLDGLGFRERLVVSLSPTAYQRTVQLAPGRHTLTFWCTGRPLKDPSRTIVFKLVNFQLGAPDNYAPRAECFGTRKRVPTGRAGTQERSRHGAGALPESARRRRAAPAPSADANVPGRALSLPALRHHPDRPDRPRAARGAGRGRRAGRGGRPGVPGQAVGGAKAAGAGVRG